VDRRRIIKEMEGEGVRVKVGEHDAKTVRLPRSAIRYRSIAFVTRYGSVTSTSRNPVHRNSGNIFTPLTPYSPSTYANPLPFLPPPARVVHAKRDSRGTRNSHVLSRRHPRHRTAVTQFPPLFATHTLQTRYSFSPSDPLAPTVRPTKCPRRRHPFFFQSLQPSHPKTPYPLTTIDHFTSIRRHPTACKWLYKYNQYTTPLAFTKLVGYTRISVRNARSIHIPHPASSPQRYSCRHY
jgi:hypothetical protein